ncbi:single-stranded DNA-binding protein 4 [Terrapene carolina triunguis]|uniref:single-stranded DNA-binding protein 4 n=1 Tax=Terrapene triunguis TaxID=2587831 RepID=UPI001156725D|nr:single-stranded DNA-binding protein 4 [Terrapene carolina triunguis]
MYAKGKGSAVPSDSQAREKLALYVYEYLLHVGAQKSAQTFLSEIRWEKNITLGEPPGFLHSWWCVFWDLYCAAPDRRETCEHSSEAKAFHDYSAAAAPSPVMGNMPPNDGMPGGPMPPGFFQGPPGSQPSPHAQPPPHNPAAPMLGPHSQPFMSPRYPGGPRPSLRMPNQPPVGVPGSQPLLPNTMDPSTRSQGHPNMGGPMQRMNPPRGMAGMAPQHRGEASSIARFPSPLLNTSTSTRCLLAKRHPRPVSMETNVTSPTAALRNHPEKPPPVKSESCPRLLQGALTTRPQAVPPHGAVFLLREPREAAKA